MATDKTANMQSFSIGIWPVLSEYWILGASLFTKLVYNSYNYKGL